MGAVRETERRLKLAALCTRKDLGSPLFFVGKGRCSLRSIRLYFLINRPANNRTAESEGEGGGGGRGRA